MEEETKVQPTSEPNPTGDEQVNTSDLEDENGKKPTPAANEGEEHAGEGQKPSEGEGQKPNPPKQSRKTDAQYAEERRRKKEREEAERKKREDEIRRQAVFEVKSGQVTAEELSELGLAKVEDEDQLFLVESLRKAKADGVENPQAAAYQALFKKQAADKADAKAKTEAEEAEKQKRVAIVAQDQANFKAKFGKTTAEVMKGEPEFMELFGGLIDVDKGNFTELYAAYQKMKSQQRSDAKADGSFPTTTPATKPGDEKESDEDFKKRYIAKYGRW